MSTPRTGDDAEAVSQPSAASAQIRSFIAGGFGGVCAVICGHPFDLVKVRLQTSERGVYTGAVDVVRKSIARDGLRRGLYAGVSAPLAGVSPMFAVSFWGYDLGKTIAHSVSPSSTPDAPLSIGQVAAAGFFSAIPMTVITAPFERIKVILQVQGQQQQQQQANLSKQSPSSSAAASTSSTPVTRPTTTTKQPPLPPHQRGALDVVRHLYRTGGLRSVFRGSTATLARDGPGSAAYFATYEYIKRRLTPPPPPFSSSPPQPPPPQLSLLAISAAGAAAGIAMWVPVFPVDTVKSRLQTAEEGAGTSITKVVRELYAKGGVRAFYPGFGPALARAVPANAATFLGVEVAHQVMRKVLG